MGFLRRYDLNEEIAKGHFAQVFSCTNKATDTVYAVKTFTVEKWTKSTAKLDAVRREARILRRVQQDPHTSIMRLIDLFAEYKDCKIYMVLERAPEGELFNLIVQRQRLAEDESRKVIYQVFSALDFLHGLGWAHRDIKPENILLFDTETLFVKVADFGLAIKISSEPDTSKYATLPGSIPSYAAPEVLEETKHGLGIDVWSAGVVLYICLCGFPPFSDELYSRDFPFTLTEQIKMGRFDYPSPYWDSVGDPALDLIDNMLVVDSEKRFTIKQCIDHPWEVNTNRDLVGGIVRSASPELLGGFYVPNLQ